MKHYSKLRAVVASFYASALYRDVAFRWRGCGLSYIVLLVTISVIIVGLFFLYVINNIDGKERARHLAELLFSDAQLPFEENVNRILTMAEEIPQLTFKDGLLKVAEKQPLFIRDPYTKREFVIIDTTGHITSLENNKAVLLLTKNRVHVRPDKETNEKIYYYTDLGEANLQRWSELFDIIAQLPSIRLQQNRLITPEHKPYSVYNDQDTIIAMIDTSKEYDTIEGDIYVLVTANDIYFKPPIAKEVTHIKVADLSSQVMADFFVSVFQTSKKALSTFIVGVALPGLFLVMFVVFSILTASYAGLTRIFLHKIHMNTMEYKDAMRLTAVSLTPALFITLVLPGIVISKWLLFLMIWLGYILFAVTSLQSKK